jgi:hypothetical protein
MKQLTKKTNNMWWVWRYKKHFPKHKGVVSKFGKSKSGSKGKSTFSLLMPKQENLSQPKSSKKRKAPTHFLQSHYHLPHPLEMSWKVEATKTLISHEGPKDNKK